MPIFLKDLLSVIDGYQYIKIQYKGEILYMGQRRFIGITDDQSNICIVNILVKSEDDIYHTNDIPYITICVDRGFD